MRDKINRLANGIVETDIPKLRISPESIEQQILYGETTKFEIELTSENNIHIKGLAYSSNSKVKILTPTFGGYSALICLEVDSRYLKVGDIVKGEINLITGGGELSIPFSFHVFAGQTGNALNSLKTIEDFTIIAKEDPKTALRIFEYKDFQLALFMNDIKLRAFHTGFVGRADKNIAMEEFLVAAGAKKSVSIAFDKGKYIYTDIKERQSFTIPVHKNTWGYINLSVNAASEFIYLHNKTIKNEDFADNTCQFRFDIIPKKLCFGKNTAIIEFYSASASYQVELEVHHKIEKNRKKNYHSYKKPLYNYFKYRLDYECVEDAALPAKMIEELDKLSEYEDKKILIKLLKAEALYLNGDEYLAKAILDEEREEIRFNRHNNYYEYILFEYISLLADELAGQRDYFIKQVKKLIEEGYYEFFPFLIKADTVLKDSPALLFEFIDKVYRAGVRSPLLYLEYCRILNKHPEFLHGMFDMEIAAINFGIHHNVISDTLLLDVAGKAKNMISKNKRHYLLLKKLYYKNMDKEVLAVLCNFLINNNYKDQSVHIWYEMAIEESIAISGLFEYYMYTLPKDKDRLIHESVLAYFQINNILEQSEKLSLYENIIEYAQKEGDIYKDFMRQIKSFVVEQLLSLSIDKRLAKIYKEVITKDLIDKRLARVIPTILSAYEIEYDSKYIKSAVVIYPELKGEQIYSLDENTAYVPLFSDSARILLQDAFGNRYSSVNAKKELILDMPEILETCRRIYPAHTLFELKRLHELLEGGEISFDDAKLMREAARDMNLSDSFRSDIISGIIKFFKEDSKKPSGPDIWVVENNYDFLLEADKEHLSAKDRGMICETFINIGYLTEAYEMLLRYGHNIVSSNYLLKLCRRVISNKQYDIPRLAEITFELVRLGYGDQVLLEYLCRNFNGSTADMYMVLNAAVSERVDTFDMEERLISQMLFSGNTKYLDQSFAWYVSRKKTNELIVRAYFTVKSEDFFLKNKELPQRVFEYLENAIKNTEETENIPTIYKLAATKYYADMSDIDEERRTFLAKIVNDLIDKGYVFPYYKKLAKWIVLPRDIKDKEMVVYHGEKFSLPKLRSRILPYEDAFKTDDLRRMYMNIFVKDKLLFSGDVWEYEIYEEDETGKEILKKRGKLQHISEGIKNAQSRFEKLNGLDILSADKNQELEEKLEDYIIKDELTSKFFDLL